MTLSRIRPRYLPKQVKMQSRATLSCSQTLEKADISRFETLEIVDTRKSRLLTPNKSKTLCRPPPSEFSVASKNQFTVLMYF